MSQTRPLRNGYRFGTFELDLAAGELRKAGFRLRLQDQPLRVLTLLLDNAGEPVLRERLQKELWPEDTFVDFEHGLNTAINKIRQALGDSAASPRFVETLPRRGYRFIAPVEKIEPLNTENQASGQQAPPVEAVGPPDETKAGQPETQTAQPAASAAANEERANDQTAASVSGVVRGRAKRTASILALTAAALLGLLMVLFSFFGLAMGIFSLWPFRSDEAVTEAPPSRASPPAAVIDLPATQTGDASIRILAGQSARYYDTDQRQWGPDRFYQGGETTGRSNAVSGAPSAGLFRGERYGAFKYSIPVEPGTYRVTLWFAETWFGRGNPGGGGDGARRFDVDCNGVTAIRDLDVHREAGGSNRAIARTFRGVQPNNEGKIVLSFVPVVENAMVNAIEVIREEASVSPDSSPHSSADSPPTR